MALTFEEFYVTKGSAVADTNGGSMYAGNSQVYTNDGPCTTRTNCSSDATGAFVTDDDAGGWGNAAAGDWICFDTGGTKEFSIIAAVTGDVLTLTGGWFVTGSASGKTVNVGGAWATIQHAADTITSSYGVTYNAPRINIKYDEAAYAEQVDIDTNGGTVIDPITFEGYETTAGDGCPNGNKPLIESSTAGDTWELGALNYLAFINFKVKNSAAGGHAIDGGVRARMAWLFVDAEIAGSGTGYAMSNVKGNVIGSHIKVSSSGAASSVSTSGTTLYKCTFEGGKNALYNIFAGDDTKLIDCFFNGTTDGDWIRMASSVLIASCTIDAGADTNINMNSGDGVSVVMNTIITNAVAEYGLDATSGAIWGIANTFGAAGEANNSGAHQGLYHALRDDQTADPKYTNQAGGDVTLASDSPCKADAEPDTMPGTALVTYQDAGAFQRQEDASGGGLLQGNKRANMQ